MADTYANQSSRAGSILPFTSALAGLCAAVRSFQSLSLKLVTFANTKASAAAVELLPLISVVELQSFISVIFPSGAALFTAAAAVELLPWLSSSPSFQRRTLASELLSTEAYPTSL